MVHCFATSTRRRLGPLGLAAAAAAVALPRGAGAQAAGWPDRPARLIVPFGPGGAIDTLSRTVAGPFPAHANGQPLVVENRGGAGGTIAGAFVAQQRPDGYTLMMADLGANAIGHELIRGLSYDPTQAFTPIVHLVNLPLVVIVRRGLDVRDLPGLIAYAKGRREPVTYASPGVGHPTHLADEMLGRMAGIALTPVHYRSGADVVRSLLQNETDFAVISVSTAQTFIREGKVRPIAVCSTEPVPALPGVAPVAATLPGFEATTWHGIAGPAGMPAELVGAINRVFNTVIALPEVREAVQRVQAGEVIGGTPEQFAAFIRREVERWTPLIREAGIRAD
jgi:tripartite-type tricarboxylate transporter receptor subunit TctC